MRLKSSLLIVLIFLLGLAGCSSNQVEEANELNGVAYSKLYNGDITPIENISVNQSDDQVHIQFTLKDQAYEIKAAFYEQGDGGENKYVSEENESGIMYNVMELNGHFTGHAVNRAVSPINFSEEDQLAFNISEDVSVTELIEAIQKAHTMHQEQLESIQP